MQTQEQILKLAKTYGVPLPETCEKLAWQGESVFSLCIDKKSKQYYYVTDMHWSSPYVDDFVCYAPQMHEIAMVIDTIDGAVDIKNKYLMSDNHGLFIKNHHYAEAYAQLYLKLKEQGLL